MLLNNAHIAPLIWWDHDWLRFSGCWPAIAKGASGVIICFDSAVHNQDVVDKWYEGCCVGRYFLLRTPAVSLTLPELVVRVPGRRCEG